MGEKRSTLPSDNTGPVSHDEARQILNRYNDGHFKQGEGPRYTIPADVMRDDDIRLGAYIKQNQERDNTQHERLERARELLRSVQQWIDGWDPNFTQDEAWPETGDAIDTLVRELESDDA